MYRRGQTKCMQNSGGEISWENIHLDSSHNEHGLLELGRGEGREELCNRPLTVPKSGLWINCIIC
jgi:hypothetical protein